MWKRILLSRQINTWVPFQQPTHTRNEGIISCIVPTLPDRIAFFLFFCFFVYKLLFKLSLFTISLTNRICHSDYSSVSNPVHLQPLIGDQALRIFNGNHFTSCFFPPVCRRGVFSHGCALSKRQ